jgi:F-type H+-transporting ATPase subunit b
MFSTAEFWVLIAFFLLLLSIGKRAFSYLTTILDTHSQKVATQLEEAERLYGEALSLLNSYKKKHAEAIEQVENILSFAEKEADEIKKTGEQAYARFVHHKETAMSDRLGIEKEEALAKLRREAVAEALALVEHVLSANKKEREKLTETSLKKIEELSLKFLPPDVS